jgi:hypothetical protein
VRLSGEFGARDASSEDAAIRPDYQPIIPTMERKVRATAARMIATHRMADWVTCRVSSMVQSPV